MMMQYPIPRPIRQGGAAVWIGLSALHRWWRVARLPGEIAAPGELLVVGSLRSGGTGKTDWVDWIAARDPSRAILAHPTGDEDAWLESRHRGRVFRDRSFPRAWARARKAGFARAVCDGGLQDPALDRCPAILLGSAKASLEELHPFGPFRQRRAARSVDLHLEEGDGWSWRCELDLTPGAEVLLGASVAQTEIVITDLRSLGAIVKAVLPTRDHAPFREDLVRALEARHPGAVWVVTAKDAARGELARLRAPVAVLRRTLEVSPSLAARLDALLELPAHPRG